MAAVPSKHIDEDELHSTISDRLRLRELEIQTQYQIKSLSDSFDNLKLYFDTFKANIEDSVNSLRTHVEAVIEDARHDIKEYIEKDTERNHKTQRRLDFLTFILVAEFAGLSLEKIVGIATRLL